MSELQPEPPHRVLDGRYVLEHELGRGGMGQVFSGRDLKLSRPVAIKVLQGAPHAGAAARFALEARAASSLSHPNVLSVFDAGAVDGQPYLVTELLRGETLGQRLCRGRLELGEALRIAILIARGVAAAHESGVVHRDLKPDNVFILEGGWVKVLDFGISKILGAGIDLTMSEDGGGDSCAPGWTAKGAFLGTVGYAAPEQLRGQRVNLRADLFAFGAVLHEMLGGEKTFGGDDKEQRALAVLNEPPPPLPAALPAGLRELVARCLEKEPGARPASAKEVAAALEQIARQLELPAVGETKLPPARQASRGRFGRRALLAGLIVPAGLAAVAFVASRPEAAATRGEKRIEELAERGTRSSDALRAFLQGEAKLREGDRWGALQFYRTAVASDPQFGLAFYRVATTAKGAEPGLARDAIVNALKAASPLQERERRLMRAQDAADRGEIEKAVSLYREAVAAQPDDVEALRDLGDFLFVYGPIKGWPIDEAANATRQALVLDPFDVEALRSLIDVAQMQSQPGVVLALTERFNKLKSDVPLDLRWAHHWSAGDAAGRRQVIDEAVNSGRLDVQQKVFLRAAFGDASLSDARALAERLADAPQQRAFWLSGLAVIDLAGGRPSSARARLAEAMQISNGGSLPHFAAWMETLDFVDPNPVQLAAARAMAARMDEVRMPDFKPLRLYLDGALAVRAKDFDGAERDATALEALPVRDGTTLAKDLALGVRARMRAATGSHQDALALLQRQSLAIGDQTANLFSRISEQRLRSVLLEEEAGRAAEALRWETLTFDSPLEIPLAPAVHLRLCELSLKTGDASAARAHANATLAAWSHAEPELAAEVERAQRCQAAASQGMATSSPR